MYLRILSTRLYVDPSNIPHTFHHADILWKFFPSPTDTSKCRFWAILGHFQPFLWIFAHLGRLFWFETVWKAKYVKFYDRLLIFIKYSYFLPLFTPKNPQNDPFLAHFGPFLAFLGPFSSFFGLKLVQNISDWLDAMCFSKRYCIQPPIAQFEPQKIAKIRKIRSILALKMPWNAWFGANLGPFWGKNDTYMGIYVYICIYILDW